jgi:toxin ParE1/3/4
LSEYQFRPRALADLDEVLDVATEAWNEFQADRYLLGLRDDLEMLAEQPGLGRARDDLHPGLRAFLYSRHIVFYQGAARGIDVVRILHVRRDISPEEF